MENILTLLWEDDVTRKKKAEITGGVSGMLVPAELSLIRAKELRGRVGHRAGDPNPFVSVTNVMLASGVLKMNQAIAASGLPEGQQEKLRAQMEKRIEKLLAPYEREFGYSLRKVPLEAVFRYGILERHATQMLRAKDKILEGSTERFTPETLALAAGIERAYEVSRRGLDKGIPDTKLKINLLLDSVELVILLQRTGHISKYEHPTG